MSGSLELRLSASETGPDDRLVRRNGVLRQQQSNHHAFLAIGGRNRHTLLAPVPGLFDALDPGLERLPVVRIDAAIHFENVVFHRLVKVELTFQRLQLAENSYK